MNLFQQWVNTIFSWISHSPFISGAGVIIFIIIALVTFSDEL